MSDIRQFAESICASTMPPWGTSGYYTYEEWRSAADYALETDDFTEMEFMEAREKAYERFEHVRGEDADFNDWCTIHAPEAAWKRMEV